MPSAQRSSPPPRPRPASPGSCPSKAARGRARPPARARRAKCGRESSGSSLNGGIVISPTTRTGQRSMNAPRSSGVDAALALLAGDVDLDQDLGAPAPPWRPSCSSAESRMHRVDQADQRQDALDLAALQVADEVPVEVPAPPLVLLLQILRAGSRRPASTPASASAPISSSGRTSSAARSSTLGPASRPDRARLARDVAAGSMSRNGSTIRRSSRRSRPVGRSARRHRDGRRTLALAAACRWPRPRSSRRPHAPAACGPPPVEIEHAAVSDLVAQGREGREDLLPHLVAAGADAGADRCGRPPDPRDAVGDDPGGKPAPAAVQHRDAVRPRRARSAGSRLRTRAPRCRVRSGRDRRPPPGPCRARPREPGSGDRHEPRSRIRGPVARSPRIPGRARGLR